MRSVVGEEEERDRKLEERCVGIEASQENDGFEREVGFEPNFVEAELVAVVAGDFEVVAFRCHFVDLRQGDVRS